MDNLKKAQCEELRNLESEEAATWLMSKYPIESPDYGEAIMLMPHRSWKKADQIRLGKYYLQKIPFANGKAYEMFASFMPIQTMIKIIQEQLKEANVNVDLLLYHLTPVLKKYAKSASDNDVINQFLSEIR